MKETREFLKSIGMPEGDAYDLPTSEDSTVLRYREYRALK